MGDLDDYLPCYKKNDYEVAATKKLLSLSAEYPKERGDPGCLAAASCKKTRDKSYLEEKGTSNETSENSEMEQEPKTVLTSAKIYELLRLNDRNENVALDFCRWQLCPTIHADTVNYGIVDASRLKPRIKKFSQFSRNVNSATGKLCSRASTTPSKLKTSQSSRSNSHQRPSSVSSRPSSNSRREELGGWQEPPPPIPIEYSFKYLKHSRQYSDQYREVYTYSKIRQKSLGRCSFITGVTIPQQRLATCMKGKAVMSGKSVPSTTPTCSDPDQLKSSMINWQLNQQLLESCDVELSVNNPSPTEIAMLSKIPHIHRSSPSIPSNTNGKYGGKGTDKPYPFQLNISADAKTVIAPTVKRVGRPIYIH
ncbi:uncharacterized protein LOC110983043 [Acanthaster planci]|uniref:Uncharacterized protein LOC110983043 n=1 Tax=Acanthaster planci TaxID=133434 RepID=A0A8B7YWB7_ACAPL|nr:uncharacterized protein LOC110983043 [Acanthaster planci]XP_022097614.1 uncharacterized protein LOC110983043 [Acanthaster planci]